MRLVSLSLLAALAVLPGAVQAQTFTDGFATATQGLDVTAAGNFTAVDGTNVDVLGASDGYQYLCSGVATCVDLGGSGGNPFGNLESNTTFAAGTYDLSFVLSGSGRGLTTTTEVEFGNFSQSFTLPSGGPNVDFSEFVSTTGGTLDFILTDSANGNIGTILDSASVSATPEPSSLVLLGSGLLSGAGALMRRRKR